MNDNIPQVANPFASAQVVANPMSALTSVDQQRAIAEVQAHMLVARGMPRDPKRALDLLINDCMIVALAEDAMYQYSRGGTDIAGPSIKLTEAAARRWGNIRSGIEEISRGLLGSECRAYAWDLESGYYDERKFHVKHWRDTKKGGYQITDERDIYELIANMGQRRKRAVLLSIIPTHVMDAAVAQCELTLKAKADTSPEGLKKLVEAFAPFGVNQVQIEVRIQRRLEAITPAQVVGLKRVYASLRDGMSVPGDWFDPLPVDSPPPPPPPPADGQPQYSPAPTPAPAATGKSAKMREKIKANVAQTGEQPAAQGRGESSAEAAGDAGSNPAVGTPVDDQAMELRFVDYKSALDECDSPEKLADLMARAKQFLTPSLYEKLKQLANRAGG